MDRTLVQRRDRNVTANSPLRYDPSRTARYSRHALTDSPRCAETEAQMSRRVVGRFGLPTLALLAFAIASTSSEAEPSDAHTRFRRASPRTPAGLWSVRSPDVCRRSGHRDARRLRPPDRTRGRGGSRHRASGWRDSSRHQVQPLPTRHKTIGYGRRCFSAFTRTTSSRAMQPPRTAITQSLGFQTFQA